MGKSFHIITFGCQMNEHDSEILAGMLEEKGYEKAESREDANVVILNTCSVRENADKRFFGTLGQIKNKREEETDFLVCVCGCMMQQQVHVDTVKTKYPWVDLIFGTHNIHMFPDLLDRVLTEKEKITELWQEAGPAVEGLPARRLFDSKALINITFGCNNFCTYCIVPYTRGRERSRHPDAVLQEARDAVESGAKEIMLLGQNVNSYRGEEGTDFAALIYRLQEVEGLERIRFMTSHPKDISSRLIAAFGDCSKLCKNIHLPLQSGSDRILKRMNRKYTAEHYYKKVEELRKVCPEITMSTDIIVGFPGETEEDFEDTLSLVERVGYDSAFTFMYSIRQGTPAEKYEDQVPEDVKHRRFERLVDLVNRHSAEKNAAYLGRVEKVLVEGKSKNDENRLTGRTDGFKLVNFSGSHRLTGKIVDVRITGARTFSLEGELA